MNQLRDTANRAGPYLGSWVIVLGFSVASSQGFADSFCFSQAQSYYEQLYCEVRASGKGRNLPTFNEFKKNNPITQALLLKRPGAAAGIEVKMPKSDRTGARPMPRSITQFPPVSVDRQSRDTQSRDGQPVATTPSVTISKSSCVVEKQRIRCGDRAFHLTANRNNNKLAEGVLDTGNRLGLLEYDGDINDVGQVQRYLIANYRHYIRKMLEIGLGGVTMTYGKFAYLFSDLRQRGVSFVERFERMYEFLKKDKRAMSVSESLADTSGLQLDDCAPLATDIYVCVHRGRNYLFLNSGE